MTKFSSCRYRIRAEGSQAESGQRNEDVMEQFFVVLHENRRHGTQVLFLEDVRRLRAEWIYGDDPYPPAP
jgi:hypothetical protein